MKIAESSPKKVENTVGNGEIARDEQFSPFPTVFSKDLYCRHVKHLNKYHKQKIEIRIASSEQSDLDLPCFKKRRTTFFKEQTSWP